jgi:hypothetical protein
MAFIPRRSAEAVHGRQHITNMLNGYDDVVRLSVGSGIFDASSNDERPFQHRHKPFLAHHIALG